VSSLLSLQHTRVSVSQHENSGIFCHCYTILISYISLGLVYAIMACLQDVVPTVPQYPFVLEDPSTVSFKECSMCRVVSPQLSFTFHLRPTDRWLPKARCSTYGEDFIQALLFYSTFEQLGLPCFARLCGCSEVLQAHPNTSPLKHNIFFNSNISGIVAQFTIHYQESGPCPPMPPPPIPNKQLPKQPNQYFFLQTTS
jgi:hypothetical protein